MEDPIAFQLEGKQVSSKVISSSEGGTALPAANSIPPIPRVQTTDLQLKRPGGGQYYSEEEPEERIDEHAHTARSPSLASVSTTTTSNAQSARIRFATKIAGKKKVSQQKSRVGLGAGAGEGKDKWKFFDASLEKLAPMKDQVATVSVPAPTSSILGKGTTPGPGRATSSSNTCPIAGPTDAGVKLPPINSRTSGVLAEDQRPPQQQSGMEREVVAVQGTPKVADLALQEILNNRNFEAQREVKRALSQQQQHQQSSSSSPRVNSTAVLVASASPMIPPGKTTPRLAPVPPVPVIGPVGKDGKPVSAHHLSPGTSQDLYAKAKSGSVIPSSTPVQREIVGGGPEAIQAMNLKLKIAKMKAQHLPPLDSTDLPLRNVSSQRGVNTATTASSRQSPSGKTVAFADEGSGADLNQLSGGVGGDGNSTFILEGGGRSETGFFSQQSVEQGGVDPKLRERLKLMQMGLPKMSKKMLHQPPATNRVLQTDGTWKIKTLGPNVGPSGYAKNRHDPPLSDGGVSHLRAINTNVATVPDAMDRMNGFNKFGTDSYLSEPNTPGHSNCHNNNDDDGGDLSPTYSLALGLADNRNISMTYEHLHEQQRQDEEREKAAAAGVISGLTDMGKNQLEDLLALENNIQASNPDWADAVAATPYNGLQRIVGGAIEHFLAAAPLVEEEQLPSEDDLEVRIGLRKLNRSLHPVTEVSVSSGVPDSVARRVAIANDKYKTPVNIEHETSGATTTALDSQQPGGGTVSGANTLGGATSGGASGSGGHSSTGPSRGLDYRPFPHASGILIDTRLPEDREERLALLRAKQREAEVHFGFRSNFSLNVSMAGSAKLLNNSTAAAPSVKQ